MIEDYSFGRVTVAGETYTKDLIIFPDHVRPSWWRVRGHEVCAEDVEGIAAAAPNVVVIGTGANGLVQVLPSASQALADVGARVIVEPTAAACRTFNELRSAGEQVVAALHLTC